MKQLETDTAVNPIEIFYLICAAMVEIHASGNENSRVIGQHDHLQFQQVACLLMLRQYFQYFRVYLTYPFSSVCLLLLSSIVGQSLVCPHGFTSNYWHG
jgi:hypothetical protein